MSDIITFQDGLQQIDIREDGATEHFYDQHIITVSVRPDDAKSLRMAHYRSLHGSPGTGIPYPTGFSFPKTMAKQVADALLELVNK